MKRSILNLISGTRVKLRFGALAISIFLALCFFVLRDGLTDKEVTVSSLVGSRFVTSNLGDYDNGYPRERYEFVLDTFKKVYGPIIARRGGEFKILSDWTDGAVNMWAWRIGAEYWLEIPGGMSRYYLIIEEAFVLSICHELGHLLGGLPLKGSSREMPISLEGQSDYFATLKCMRRMFDEIDHYELPESSNLSRKTGKSKIENFLVFEEVCRQQPHWPRSHCERGLKGALSLTSYYAKLEKVGAPKIETPSSVQVEQTLKVHPPAQCRFDTYLAGMFCRADPETDLSYENHSTGACVSNQILKQMMNQSEHGSRPRCWYKP